MLTICRSRFSLRYPRKPTSKTKRDNQKGNCNMLNRRSTLKSMVLGPVATLAIAAVGIPSAQAENKELKVGFVGVTSGPAAAWGTSNVRSMQTRAAWLNEKGGVKIGNDTYNINIVTFDDQKDPKRAIAGMEKMAQEGIHYVVG